MPEFSFHISIFESAQDWPELGEAATGELSGAAGVAASSARVEEAAAALMDLVGVGVDGSCDEPAAEQPARNTVSAEKARTDRMRKRTP